MRAYMTLSGDYSDQKFEPMPWFRSAVKSIYGPRNIEGNRLVEDVALFCPKGSSKTVSVAALVLTELCLTRTTGTELYSSATSKQQAANTFRAAEQMVNANAVLRARLKVVPSFKKIYRRDDPTSFYIALSSDGNVHDGFAPQMVIRDELHLWRTKASRTLFAILEKSARTKRKSPLIVDISTAGEKDHSELCWNRWEQTQRWLEHDPKHRDKRFYGQIWAADQKRMDEEEYYWTTKEARVMANPAHEDNGGHIKDSIFADMVEKAKTNGLLKAEFCRYHLNYWGVNDQAVLDYPSWVKCGGGIDMRDWPSYDPELAMHKWGLVDNPCYLAADLGATRDLSALAAVFPPYKTRLHYAFLVWYWMPAAAVEVRTLKDQVPYADWVGKGLITAHKDAKTSPRELLPRIKWCRQMFRVKMLAYDPWNADELVKRIKTGDENGRDAIDMECVEVKQDIPNLNHATKWIIAAPESGLIMHGNNPVLNWNARNLGVVRDTNNNVKPLKVRDEDAKKIDGMAAVITGLRHALVAIKAPTGDTVRSM